MRKVIIGFMSVGFLFSAGCSAPPAGNSPSPKASQSSTTTTTTTTVTSSSPVPASTATVTASPSPAVTVTATPDGSSTPGATGTPTAAGKKISDDTGVNFAVPSGYTESPQSDGELQLNGKDGEFVAVQSGDDMAKTFDTTVAMMKQVGKDSFKTEGPAQEKEEGGLKGKIQMGTMDVKGQKMQWAIAVIQGKKTFRVAAIGPTLKTSSDFNSLMQTIKKQ